MKKHKTNLKVGLVLTIMAIPVVAYVIMHASTYFLSPEGPLGLMGGLLMAAFIAIGLAVPYWMLKLLVKKEHLDHPEEKELHLRDLPKDQDQYFHDQEQHSA